MQRSESESRGGGEEYVGYLPGDFQQRQKWRREIKAGKGYRGTMTDKWTAREEEARRS